MCCKISKSLMVRSIILAFLTCNLLATELHRVQRSLHTFKALPVCFQYFACSTMLSAGQISCSAGCQHLFCFCDLFCKICLQVGGLPRQRLLIGGVLCVGAGYEASPYVKLAREVLPAVRTEACVWTCICAVLMLCRTLCPQGPPWAPSQTSLQNTPSRTCH